MYINILLQCSFPVEVDILTYLPALNFVGGAFHDEAGEMLNLKPWTFRSLGAVRLSSGLFHDFLFPQPFV